jgi:hypothetical protein
VHNDNDFGLQPEQTACIQGLKWNLMSWNETPGGIHLARNQSSITIEDHDDVLYGLRIIGRTVQDVHVVAG